MTEVTNPLAHVPHLRILFCKQCRSIEELPDYEGRPESDETLEFLVKKHGTSHQGQLFRIPIGFWLDESYKRRVIDQIRGGSKGLNELDSTYYDTKNQFQEDAAKCYEAHLRPKGQCPDFMSDKKRLVPDTGGDRKELGLSPKQGSQVKLCDFCVVRRFNERKSRGE